MVSQFRLCSIHSSGTFAVLCFMALAQTFDTKRSDAWAAVGYEIVSAQNYQEALMGVPTHDLRCNRLGPPRIAPVVKWRLTLFRLRFRLQLQYSFQAQSQ